MILHGRVIDPISLFSQWCEFPDVIDKGDWSPLVYCPNPDHDNHRSPAFNVNLKRNYVKCYAECGISGSYERAVAIILGLKTKKGEPDERAARAIVLRGARFPSAREIVQAPRHGRGTRKGDPDHLRQDEDAYERGAFSYLGRRALDYLAERGISDDSRFDWGIGYDEETERIVIPAYDERGTLRFLIRRGISPQTRPKYLYTKGTIKTSLLFGACRLDRDLVRSFGLILCEGPFDAIKLHQHGLRNAAAILGTGLSQSQARLVEEIDQKRVYLLMDKDYAGIQSIKRSVSKLRKRSVWICRYPKGVYDPADMSSEQVRRSTERALPLWKFNRILASR